MKARTLLVDYLRMTKKFKTEDPLQHTKDFLDYYTISQNDFFVWINKEASQFNWSINNDENVKTLLQ